MEGEVSVEARGQPQDSHGEWLREVGLGSWEQTARVGLGVPQSLQDYSGAEVAGAICVAHSWLQWEEAVGRQIASQYKLFPMGRVSFPPMDK